MLLSHLTTLWERLTNRRMEATQPLCSIPLLSLRGIPEEELPAHLHNCPVALRYFTLFAPLDWSQMPDRREGSYRGFPPTSRTPFVAAYLVKLDQGLPTLGALQRYLHEHPTLAWLLGFGPNRPIPPAREWARILRKLHNDSLQVLLEQSISQTILILGNSIDPSTFGDTISLDTKHILAWVRENNPKEYVEDRFNKKKQPKGDPDCKLGCKERTNQRAKTPTTEGNPASTVAVGTFYWGYASGIVVTKVEGYGEIVLAEITQPFNASELSYFFPLMKQVEHRLGGKPRFGALDAAFDAVYVYDYFHDAGGFAAVPRAERGRKGDRSFSSDGLPLCDADLPMPRKSTYTDRKGLIPQQKGRYVCPLLFPDQNADACPIAHPKWEKGGCRTTLSTSPGARLRYQLDRQSDAYQRVYAQRTASERIFSQATALGMERPKLRNQASIANHNTLTYVLLNLRTLQRVCQRVKAN